MLMMGRTLRKYALFLIVGAFFCCFTPAFSELLLYYDFDTPSGSVVIDLSGYDFHGIMEYGFPDSSTALPEYIESVDVDHGQALLFGYDDGVAGAGWNDINVGRDPNLAYIGQNWSMAFWGRQDDNGPEWSGNYPRIISCPNYEIELGAEGDMYTYFWPWEADPPWGDPASWDFTMAPSPDLGVWFHMAVSYDGTTFRQYIDGQEEFTRTGMGSFVESTWFDIYPDATLRIATQSWIDKSYLVGALDDVAIWNETLSPTEVLSVMSGEYFIPYKGNVQAPEVSPPSLLFNPTFIYEYSVRQLDSDEVWAPHTPWNWNVQVSDPNNYGIRNVSLWDGGDPKLIKYAAFIADGDLLFQKPFEGGAWSPAREGVRYNLKTRLAGDNAVDSTVGVKYYLVDYEDPNNPALIADLNTIISEDQKWYELSTQFVADADADNKYFMAEAYVQQGTGNPAIVVYGYFDEIVVNVDGAVNCTGVKNLGGLSDADFDQDCEVALNDYSYLAEDWEMGFAPEPRSSATELLANSDFYADVARIPAPGNSDGGPPEGWVFEPATVNPDVAGIWNLANVGKVNSVDTGDYQPAGGSVVVYIDPNTTVQQVVDSTQIQEGTTYYLSAMVAGVELSYQNIIRVVFEYLDNPETPTTVTEIATREFVLADQTLWRKLTAEFTADSTAAGKYFRVRGEYEKTDFSAATGWGLFGYLSIDTVKPDEWPRNNLLQNGDLEDVSNLSQEDQFKLLATYNEWTIHSSSDSSTWPPGWTYEWVTGSSNGMQCMLWAPPPQPVQGRVSIWMDADVAIHQKVTSETIQEGKTYYLDFVGSIAWSAYNSGAEPWPDPDPNMAAELYWLAPGEDDLSGIKGEDWGYITRAVATADGSLGAMGGHWQIGQTSYTADSSTAGNNFFVRIAGSAPYVTIEEIFLSDEPMPVIDAYTCYEQVDKFGTTIATDLNDDCVVGIGDLLIFAQQWLDCVDPEGCL
jgi:hypothetical protein